MKSRADIKNEAKSVIKDNLKFFLLALLPVTVTNYMTRFPGLPTVIGMILWGFILIGLSWMCLNMVHNKKINEPLIATLDVFSKRYFWPMLKLTCVVTIRLVGWFLLLIVPGVIKMIEYSQSFFILKDCIDKGEEVTSTQCIKESRKLMQGKKENYAVLLLSFIGWMLLINIIVGFVANIFGRSALGLILWFIVTMLEMFLMTYIYYSQAIFYTELGKSNE